MIRRIELKQMHSEKIRNDAASIRKSGQEFKKGNELHAAVPTKTVAMLPIKKLALLKTGAPCNKVVHTVGKPIPLSVMKAEIYEERKRKLPEYKDLFAALFKLPDKEIRKKIMDVINNHKPLEQRSVETQTDFVDESPNTVKNENINIGDITRHNIGAKSEETLSNDSGTNQTNDGEETLVTELPKKRKRKRKVALPQANKESRTKQIVKMNKPKATAINSNNLSLPYDTTELHIKGSKRTRIDSSISECGSDVANICEDETNPFSEVQAAHIRLENGLLPIQDAVVKNQIKKLCIHIIIWKGILKKDLNDLLFVTDEDEDLLQLAILNCCDHMIVQLILNQGLNPNCLDAESNTIIHLAILNDVDVRSMEHLMKHIDLKLLLTLNDEGYTPLHLAIRQDRFLLAERLINVLDERLTNKIFYKLDYDELETDEMLLKKQFKNYYEKICLQMIADEELSDLSIPNNHDLKQQLLQTGDLRSGNIALYFAIDNKSEHLIYFLLAHLTDPRSENLSGQDCKSFFSEYGKSLNLSLNIDNAMEKVIKILS